MAEALVSIVLEQLASVIHKQKEAEVKLDVDVDDDEVQKFTSNFQAIRSVLDDAESKQVEDLAVRDWLDKLKDTSYDIDDVLDEWITTGVRIKVIPKDSKPKRKVYSFIPWYCFCFRKSVFLQHDIAVKIKEWNRKLDVIAMEANVFNCSLTTGMIELNRPLTASIIDDVSNIHGRDHDKDTLLKMLLGKNNQTPAIPIISIVGQGGIGKTTLARLAFNDDTVNTHFDKKIWVCISEPFEEIRIAKAILESLVGDALKLVELQTMLQEIKKLLRRKKFLLVLDNLWYDDPIDWEQLKGSFKFASPRSRILVTTPNKNFANSLGTIDTNMISIGLLSEKESWSLFSQIAFFNRKTNEIEELEDIGRKILEKCKGLPFAIKIIGSLLCFKKSIEEWQSVLDSQIWELKEEKRGIFPPLILSYYALPFQLRKCLSYCAIFPKNWDIEKDRLIKLWMAQRYVRDEQNKDVELVGEEYFENLAMRSFFQDFKRDKFDGSIISCKMHDIVHDFAQFLTKNECFSIEIDDSERSRVQFSSKKGRHSRVELKCRDSIPMYIYNAKKLCSLLVVCENLSNIALSKFFCEFTCLRTLDLSCCGIKILSSEIKRLIHLRCLDLSNNKELEELPNTICELFNLQTLSLYHCLGLKKLPQGMGKLINLRHLINDGTCCESLGEMPVGIEGLTRLRTLTEFGVCRNMWEGNKASGLEYLKNLNKLRGSLSIVRLGHVGDVGEVNKAKLTYKTNLVSLRLCFRKYDEVMWENRNTGIDEAVFKVLQPPPNLEILEIRNYVGKTLRLNWMVSLTKLRFLVVYNCIYLEEWDNSKNGNEDVTIMMPSLHSLIVEDCDKLRSLPDCILQTPTLKKLEIKRCPILKERYNKEMGVDWIKISHIPCVNIFSDN